MCACALGALFPDAWQDTEDRSAKPGRERRSSCSWEHRPKEEGVAERERD